MLCESALGHQGVESATGRAYNLAQLKPVAEPTPAT
jgi:hypothetical protein